MRRVHRSSQADDISLISTRLFSFVLFLYFAFRLEPVPQRSAIE